MTIDDLQKLTNSVNWEKYITGIGLPKVDTLIVSQPKYMQALETILTENKVDDWKAYMRWTLLNNAASKLSTDIEKANWDFYSKTLSGAIKQRPRNENALQVINGATGEALGKLYVEKMFPAEAKAKAEKMIKNVIRAYEIRINNLPWMSEATKKQAIQKLNKMTVKIGYPDKWKDYSALTIKSPAEGGSYFENSKNIANWSFKKNIEKCLTLVTKELRKMKNEKLTTSKLHAAKKQLMGQIGVMRSACTFGFTIGPPAERE